MSTKNEPFFSTSAASVGGSTVLRFWITTFRPKKAFFVLYCGATVLGLRSGLPGMLIFTLTFSSSGVAKVVVVLSRARYWKQRADMLVSVVVFWPLTEN